MLKNIRNLVLGVVCVLVAMGHLGCAGYNMPATKPIPTAAPDAATARVFFIKPGGSMGKAEAFILKGTEVIGYLQNRQMFVTEVPAGKYIFMSVTSNASGVEATLAGGKTYYIRLISAPSVSSIMFAGGAENQFMVPVIPGDDQWDMRNEWIDKCQLVEPNFEKIGPWEEKYAARNEERLANFENGSAELKVLTPEQGE